MTKTRVEIDTRTGEKVEIPLTPEEIAANAAWAAAEPAPAPLKTLADQILADPAEVEKLKAALGLP